MRIITWNCQGAFRKKADIILFEKPDILVVPECEHPNKLLFNSGNQRPTDFYWHGISSHKGIGIFSFSDYKIELLDIFNPKFKYILPLRITGHNCSFTFFAIWAMNDKENREARYIGQIWLALNYYADILNNSTILIGDFNSNKIWDYKGRVGNHTDVVNKLAEKNIFSTYHKYFKEEQGKESQPTFFLQRNENKPYHIDYCFASENLIGKIENVSIGNYNKWIAYSDHTPLIINFDM